jgi:hypothetical protein
MLMIKSIFVAVALLAGLLIVSQSQSSASSVREDYLVRSSTVVGSALKPRPDAVALSDWEYTASRRPVACRGGR